MEDKVLVDINSYKVINSNNPVAYTRDVSSCIACLIHRINDSVLLHIEACDDYIKLDDFIKLIEEERVSKVDLFIGKHTSFNNLNPILVSLNILGIRYNVYNIFRNNSNETSVGYNILKDEYYMVRMNKGRPSLTRKKLIRNM